MNADAYALGVALVVVLVAMLAATAWRVRRALVPGWRGAPARLAEAVAALAIFLVTAQLLGAVGQFRRWPLVVAVAAATASAWLLTTRRTDVVGLEPEPDRRPGPGPSRSAAAAAAAAGAVVFAQWVAHAMRAFDRGIVDLDSRQYHLPFAAFFAQGGWTTRLHIAWLDPVWSFYPANSELLHATGMLAFHRDVLSPLLNLGWLVLALLAGWCIGRPWAVGPASLVGVALLTATPLMSAAGGGSAVNDIAVIALVLAAVAIALTTGPETRLVLAGAAAGLAAGTKVTAIAPVAAVTLAVVLSERRRGRAALLWGAPLVATGGSWYLRNLVRTGSPLPPAHLGLPRAPFPILDRWGYSVVDYAGNAHFWRSTVPHGLGSSFGGAWIVLVALAAGGAVLVLDRKQPKVLRLLGAAAFVSAIAYAFTPGSAYGPRGNPFLFAVNLRYVVVAFALGLVLLPVAVRDRLRLWLVLAVYLVLFALVEWSPAAELRPWPSEHRPAAVALVGVLGVVVLGGAALARRRSTRPALVAALAAVIVLVAAGGYGVQRTYLAHRYTGTGAVDAWARGVRHARIGTVGYAVQYPLAGLDLSNQVEYVGRRLPHGGIQPARTCREWRELLNRSRYDYAVAGTNKWLRQPADEAAWTEGDANARAVARSQRATVFKLTGRLDPAGCG